MEKNAVGTRLQNRQLSNHVILSYLLCIIDIYCTI